MVQWHPAWQNSQEKSIPHSKADKSILNLSEVCFYDSEWLKHSTKSRLILTNFHPSSSNSNRKTSQFVRNVIQLRWVVCSNSCNETLTAQQWDRHKSCRFVCLVSPANFLVERKTFEHDTCKRRPKTCSQLRLPFHENSAHQQKCQTSEAKAASSVFCQVGERAKCSPIHSLIMFTFKVSSRSSLQTVSALTSCFKPYCGSEHIN